jgi:hypothetical protein
MATFALLHASIVAVNSESRSGVRGKPAVKRTRLLRPATEARFFARLRIDSRTLYAAKLFSAPAPNVGPGVALIAVGDCGLLATEGIFTPETACFRRSASAVKFCVMRRLPVNSTTAMTRSGPAFASINFAAAARARG